MGRRRRTASPSASQGEPDQGQGQHRRAGGERSDVRRVHEGAHGRQRSVGADETEKALAIMWTTTPE